MNETRKHINIDMMADHIREEGYSRFAVAKGYRGVYFIAPVSKFLNMRFGMVYDNTDIHGDVIMSKEAMMVNFTLLFGYTVDYEWDDYKGAIPLKK